MAQALTPVHSAFLVALYSSRFVLPSAAHTQISRSSGQATGLKNPFDLVSFTQKWPPTSAKSSYKIEQVHNGDPVQLRCADVAGLGIVLRQAFVAVAARKPKDLPREPEAINSTYRDEGCEGFVLGDG